MKSRRKWQKALNIFYIVLAVIGGVYCSAQVMLRTVLPWRPVQKFVINRVSDMAGRRVEAGRITARLSGLTLTDVRIASFAKQPEKGHLFSARKIRLRWNPWHLLHGHILITSAVLDGVEAEVVRLEDGSFNFDGFFGAGAAPKPSAQPAREDKPFDLHLNVRSLRLTDGNLTFADWQNGQIIQAQKVFLSARGFGFDRAFPLSLNASLKYSRKGWPTQHANLGFTLWPDLANMDTGVASVRLKRVVLRHEGGVFVLTGAVKNLNQPAASLTLTGKDISDELIGFAAADLPAFSVQRLTLRADASADLAAQTANIKALNLDVHSVSLRPSGAEADTDAAQSPEALLELPDASVYLAAAGNWGKMNVRISSFTASALSSYVSGSGAGQKGKEAVSFDLTAAFGVDLAALAKGVPALQPYRPQGAVNGTAALTQQNMSADVTLQEVGAALPQAGTLSDFHARVQIKDKDHLHIASFAGKLNGGKFDGSLLARRTPNAVYVDVKASAPRIALPAAAASATQKAPKEGRPGADKAWPLPPVHVKAAVDIDSLDAPYIFGENIRFKADLRRLTPALDRAQGELSLNTGKGQIKDLNKLTNANVLTKVMFGSLSVVSKVVNTLNVFAVLDGIGSGVVAAVSPKEEKPADMVVRTVKDENGNDVQILVPYTPARVDGLLKFEKFGTDVVFKDGVADVKKGSFVSDLMSFNLQGDMNFKTQALDMRVNAAPGRHYEGGIMPLTITIGGTIDNPKGSMSLASSLTSLVTQGVANNFASRSVKKGIGGFFGLFKKNKPEPQVQNVLPQGQPARESEDGHGSARAGTDTPAAEAQPVQTPQTAASEASEVQNQTQPPVPTQASTRRCLPLPPGVPAEFVGGAGFAPAP